MESDDKIGLAVVATILASVLLLVSYNASNVKVRARAEAAIEMQKAGADTLDIPCALGDGTERYCELRAVAKVAESKKQP